MIICITSTGNTKESILDPRFGRCPYFVIEDSDSGKTLIIENPAAVSGGGAGIAAGQMMVENNVQAIITGNVGPNAMNVLKAAEIEIYRGENGPVNANIEKLLAGKLEKITGTVPSHSGLK